MSIRIGSTLGVLVTLLMLTAPAPAADPVNNSNLVPIGEKYSVTDAAALKHLIADGAHVVGDYGAFTIVQIAPGTIVPSNGVEAMPLENYVLLNAGPIDTTAPAAAALRAKREPFAGKSMHLIQFSGPVRPEWVEAIERTNVEILTYIPSNAYLVYGDANAIASLQALAMADAHVQWDGAYLDAYRINPEAAALINPAAGIQSHLFAIQLVNDPTANRETLALIDRIKSAPVLQQFEILNYVNVFVDLPTARINELAARPDVVSIGHYDMPQHCDERQAQIVAGNLSGNNPLLGTGYLAWLSSKGFTQAQFDASNFAVDVTDSGIDNGTTTPNHFGLFVNGIRPGTSRIVYNRLVGTPNAGSTLKGCDGHGTLNTHIIGGYVSTAGAPFADASGFHYGLGVAPFVKVGSSVIFDPNTYTSPNVSTLISMAYNNNVRISSNSWGNVSGNTYNALSQSYDTLVRDAQSGTAGNQQMTIVFAAGNSGPGANTVHPPATAKNIICVGAGEGVQAFGSADGCGTADSGANSANDMASFSSRGPCSDGRKKPDIVAPGSHISGGVVQTATPAATGTADACYTANGVCGGPGGSDFFPAAGQQFYTASSGTSHSTPCVAGGAALVRQFFINQGLAAPSPSMVKAFLMNSTRYMTGSGANDTLWSNSQGMGHMNLGEAFDRIAVTPTTVRDQVAGDLFTATGQTRVFTGNVADVTKPFRVTLAWTDAPGATSGSAFRNNLNLTVVVGGSTYLGNVFTGANSTTGGTADAANNVESVFRPSGVSGAFTVTVTAANINSDGVPATGGSLDQDFSLVIYNATTGCPTLSFAPASLPGGTNGSVYSQNITASGGTAPYSYSLQSGTLPTGLGLSGAGLLSGTPTANGTYNFTVQATDAASCTGTKAYTVVICSTISITPASIPGGQVGAAYNQTLTATGGTAPYTWSVASGSLPTGLSLSTGGAITGSPTTAGNFNFTARATDAGGCTADRAYAVLICGNINITPASIANATVGTAYSQSLFASGGVPTYTWLLDSGTLPGGLGLSGTGQVAGTPTTGGNFTFTIRATDSLTCSNTRTFTVQVCPVLSITPASLPAGTVGAVYSQALSGSGGTAPYSFSLFSGTLPTGLTLSPAGLLSGTPTAIGTYNFSIQTFDSTPNAGVCQATQAFSISVACPSIAVTPSTLPDSIVGAGYNEPLTAAGGTAPYSWSLISGTIPTGLVLSGAGVLSGTTNASGSYSFTVQTTDANGCNGTQAYAIDVTCPTINLDPLTLPGGTVGAAYSQSLSASGGTAPYSFSVLSGTIPTGLTLTGGGLLSGSPTAAGTFNFTAQATDSLNCTANLAYSIAICPVISVTPPTIPDATVNASYSETLVASGGTGPYSWSLVTGSPPTGISLSGAGVLSGTTTATGVSNFTVRATDAAGCFGDLAYSLTVVCPTITIDPALLPGGTVGLPYNQNLTANGGTGPYTFVVNAGTLPPGLTLAGDGTLSGSPTVAGPFNFTVQATDALACSGTRVYSVGIDTCPAITIAPATLPNGLVGIAYSQSLTPTGGIAPHVFSPLTPLPAGLTITGAGLLSGTPLVNGNVNFTIRVTDDIGCIGDQAYSLTIGTCPAITIDPATLANGLVGIPYSQTLTPLGGAGPYTFVVSTGSLPAGLTLSGAGLLSGTPTANGTANFTVQATDSLGCTGSQAYALTIGDCPAISINPASLANGLVGIAYAQSLTASGGTGAYTFVVSVGALPAGLTLSGSGLLSGTPTANGTENFTVQATDSLGCAGNQVYSLEIGNCPTIDLVPATLPSGVLNQAYSQSISAVGGTAPHAFSITTGTLPAGLSLSGAGLLSGTPTATGSENFTVQAIDADGCIGTLAYTLTIDACPAITVAPATLPNGTVGASYSQTLTATGGAAPYNWSVTAGALPGGLTLTPATGDLSGTPTTAGPFNFTVEAMDSQNCAGSQAYSLTVAGAGCPLLGDLNADAAIDGLDIQPFVDCLIAGSSPLGTCNCGDFDNSTLVDSADVLPFVAALLGP